MITITDVTVTADLHDANVFYTVYGDTEDRAGTAAALESARGVLRSAVGRQTGVKFTPTLAFTLDAVPERAKQLDVLLAEARRADEEVHRQAVGASYAGEPDPYRAPDPDDDLDDAPDAVGAPGAGDPAGGAEAADRSTAR
jgi:ribosome-binding factor A